MNEGGGSGGGSSGSNSSPSRRLGSNQDNYRSCSCSNKGDGTSDTDTTSTTIDTDSAGINNHTVGTSIASASIASTPSRRAAGYRLRASRPGPVIR